MGLQKYLLNDIPMPVVIPCIVLNPTTDMLGVKCFIIILITCIPFN